MEDVAPAKAGAQVFFKTMGSRFRGNDDLALPIRELRGRPREGGDPVWNSFGIQKACAERSFHSGFVSSMSLIFHARFHFFSLFSL